MSREYIHWVETDVSLLGKMNFQRVNESTVLRDFYLTVPLENCQSAIMNLAFLPL